MDYFKNCCSDNTNTDNEKTTELMRKDIRDDDNNINNLIKDKNEDKINIELNEKRKASEQEYQTLRNKIIYLNSRTLQLEKDAEERRKALKENEEKILHKQDLIMTEITK